MMMMKELSDQMARRLLVHLSKKIRFSYCYDFLLSGEPFLISISVTALLRIFPGVDLYISEVARGYLEGESLSGKVEKLGIKINIIISFALIFNVS